MSRKYNPKERVLRYIVALTEIRKNYLAKGKFWHLSESTEKQGIGTIPKDCLFDLVDQTEITEAYVNKILKRRIKHDEEYKRSHAPKPQDRPQTLFDASNINPKDAQQIAIGSEQAPEVILTEEICINFLKDRGYQIYKRYC